MICYDILWDMMIYICWLSNYDDSKQVSFLPSFPFTHKRSKSWPYILLVIVKYSASRTFGIPSTNWNYDTYRYKWSRFSVFTLFLNEKDPPFSVRIGNPVFYISSFIYDIRTNDIFMFIFIDDIISNSLSYIL